MKFHRILGATAVAALALGGLASPAFASDDGSQVTIGAAVTAGNRGATLAGNVTFDAVNASHSDQSPADESTSVEVNDLSGAQTGWTVTIVASDLTHTNTEDTIAAANVSVDTFGSLTVGTGVTSGSTGDIGSSRTLVSATTGNGFDQAYTQAFDLGLNVPANSLAGSYSGTVTVTIAPAS
jgi:hypothetical protein